MDLRGEVTWTRHACGAPPQGGVAAGPAKPMPGRASGWAFRLRGAALLLALPVATLAQATGGKFELAQIEAGRVQFHRTCAQCHGRNMVNAGTTVYDLRRFPVDEPDRFQHSVTNGKGNMPSFKDALTPEQIAVLWAYVGSRGGKEN